MSSTLADIVARRDDLVARGLALPDGSFAVETTSDLAEAVAAIEFATDRAAAVSHLVRRARELGALALLPDEWTEEMAESATMDVETSSGREPLNTMTPVPWDATLCVEGEQTEDMRLLERGSIRWRDLPLTLMGTLETSWGHMGAKASGRIDNIFRAGDSVDATGEFTSPFGVNEVAPLVDDRTVRGVSVDLAVFDFEYRDPETGETLTDEEVFERWWFGDPMVFVVLDGVIIAATVCPMPAIANAEIAIAASAGLAVLTSDQRALIAGALKDGGYGAKVSPADVKVISVFTPFQRSARRPQLIAAAGEVLFDTVAPPRSHFEVSEFPGNTPLTVTDDGRVFGHIATWDTCHVGIPGVCTTAPRSGTDPAYGLFHSGSWPVAGGGTVEVGKLMLGTGHASLAASREEATRHYDQPDRVGAYVRAHDGEYGIWVSGVVRPELTSAGLRELRANPPSGDWRRYNRRLELIAVCAVAVPGFPVVADARANITAAGGEVDISALIASSGLIVPTEEVKAALVAAGCSCEDLTTSDSDELLEDFADLTTD